MSVNEYNFTNKESEIDIQYIFEQQQGKTEFNFSSALCIQSTIILGKYLKLLHALTNLSIKLLPYYIGSPGLVGLSHGFSFLKNLEILKLEICTNQINSYGMKGLSNGISSLINLKKLDLIIGGQNEIKSLGCFYLGECLKYLNQLEELKLEIGEGNSIKEIGCEYLSKGFIYLQSSLKRLSLIIQQQNYINSSGAISIANAIQSFIQLNYLYVNFGQNKISSEGASQIGQAIQHLLNLVDLTLLISENHIESQGAIMIGNAFHNLFNLKNLHLEIGNRNNILTNGAQSLAQGIAMLKNLVCLKIVIIDKIKSVGIFNIGLGISNLMNLTKFYIRIENQNEVKTEGAIGLATGIQNLINLTELTIIIENQNHIEQIGSKAIGEALTKLINLKYLKLIILRGNNITEEGCKHLGQGISQLQNLTTLILEIGNQNNIKTIGCKYLADSLNSLNNLKILSLVIGGENNIDKSGQQEIERNLKALQNLENLHLCICSEGGNTGFKNMKSLIELSLHFVTENQISNFNPISNSLNNLDNLQILNIQLDWGNCLNSYDNKKLGNGISNLKQLQDLTIHIGYGNNLEDEGAINLSESIVNLKNHLKYLSLRIDADNHLTSDSITCMANSFQQLIYLNKLIINIDNAYVLQFLSILKYNNYLTKDTFEINGLNVLFQRTIQQQLQQSEIQKQEFQEIQNQELQKIQNQELQENIPYLFSLELANTALAKSYQQNWFIGMSKGIQFLNNLTYLNIYCNIYMSKSVITELMHSIEGLQNLKELKLVFKSNRYLCDDCLRVISQSISQIKNLKYLSLFVSFDYLEIKRNKSKNVKTWKSGHYLGLALKNLQNLKNLKLTIQDEGEYNLEQISKISEGIKSISCLTSLNYGVVLRNLKSSQIDILGTSFASLTNLQNLTLSFILVPRQNENINYWKEFFCKLKSLTKLRSIEIKDSLLLIEQIDVYPILEFLGELKCLRFIEIQNRLDQEKIILIHKSLIKKQKRLVSKNL